MKVGTILVASDFSADAQRALEVSTALARDFEARIVLLHAFVAEQPLSAGRLGRAMFLPEGFDHEHRAQAMRRVDLLAKETAQKEGVEIQGVAIQQPPAAAIVEQAQKLPADLVVMGTRGLAGLTRRTFGSTAERVVNRAACPVLTVKSS